MTILTRADTGPIKTLTLNAPDRLNALSDEMLAALQAEIDALASDSTARVVILAASGRAFCAGHDLRQMQAMRQAEDGGAAAFKDLFDRCTRLMFSLQRLPQPVIAQVHGLATAAGCQLVATCDMAVAADTARFGVNGVNIGLFCSTPMVALTRAIPRKAAFEMLTTGSFITAEEALRLGLINRTVPDAALAQETMRLAQTISEKLPAAVAYGKRTFYEQAALDTEAAYAHAGQVMVRNLAEAQTAEGMAAFIDKRPPNWQD